MMIKAQGTFESTGPIARALVAAMRCLAARSPDCSRRRRDDALRALAAPVPDLIARDCFVELTEAVAEMTSIKRPESIFAAPDTPPLAPAELRLIAVISKLQQNDICGALEELRRVLGSGQIGRSLFPLRSLALKLKIEGIILRAIGERDFHVITGTPQVGEHTLPSRRPQLRVAR